MTTCVQLEIFPTSMLSAVDSRARILALQAKARESNAARAAAYGASLLASSKKRSPGSLSSKTSPSYLRGGSLASSEILTVSGTWGRGTWSPLAPSERRTSEGESLSWLPDHLAAIFGKNLLPTPTAHLAKEGGFPAENTRNSPSLTVTMTRGVVGSLHPQFVEWMMGFHRSWTDLENDDLDSTASD
jgi:hypothetical protein